MTSVQKEDKWINIPSLTQPMDLVVPHLAELRLKQPKVCAHELHQFCKFLLQHPIAIKHKKNMNAIYQHMNYNISRHIKGLPLDHGLQ